MRLSTAQVHEFHSILKQFLSSISYELFLYGSRTNDNLKGGDIDLLILTSSSGVELFETKHLEILVALKKSPPIGDRRIDIKATTKEELAVDPFLKSISAQLLKL